MRTLTREQKFLYSRIAILIAAIGAVASTFAGLKGFPFWYGGFVFSLWVMLGLLNMSSKSSLWLLARHRLPFFVLYGSLAALFFFGDTFALKARLWVYPFYHSWGFLYVYLFLYPFAMLALLELFYFVAGVLGERLSFVTHSPNTLHRTLDVGESLLFLVSVGLIIAGSVGWIFSLAATFYVLIAWLLAALVKLHFHLRHRAHYVLIFAVALVFAVLLNEIPNTVAHEWIYLEAPILNMLILEVPAWIILAWLWMMLFTLRLWIFLALHPKVR